MNKKENQVYIQHSIPGRIRFRLPFLKKNNQVFADIGQMLEAVAGVRVVRANPACKGLVVRYDPELLVPGELSSRMISFLNQRSDRPLASPAAVKPEDAQAGSGGLSGVLCRFLGLTLVTLVVFLRLVVFKLPVAGNFFSPLGLAVTAAALPLVKKGLADIRQRGVTLSSFLGGGIVAAVAAGEALAALEILWITSAGNLLETWITERSRQAIRDILRITEKETYILLNGAEVSVPVDQVRIGDTVVLHTGEKIAVDGEVIKGEAMVDESPITGRSEPSLKDEGTKVYAGTFVLQGVIYVRAGQVGDRTYLARILSLVEESLENKAPVEGVADRLAQKLVRTGLAVTLITLVITRSAWRAFTVMLVMACPCATILAASTAVSAALNAAARRHILIKGGRYLEEVGRAKVICFDKTGTLTTNEPEIRQIINLDGLSENELLRLAYSTEMHNSHPVALALKKEAENRGISPINHEVCEYILGKGVRSEIHDREVIVGSHKLMDQFGVDLGSAGAGLNGKKQYGLTRVFIARDRKLLGMVWFANRERQNLEQVMEQLKAQGAEKMAMITGDARETTEALVQRLKFDECHYSVLPGEKAEIVAGLRKNGDKVLMVGDGINDALALAEADIGVAMGAGGSEVAIEAADIALVRDDLSGVVYVRSLSRQTMKVVHQNFWIATGTNVFGVTLGALGLLSPVMAGLVHIAHTLGILLNSSRLLFHDPPSRF